MTVTVREYTEADREDIERIHDAARKTELELAGLEDAFLPLSVAAEREGLFDYPGLFVAETDGKAVGFTACSEDELAWLYVDPAYRRRGIGRALAEHALKKFPGIRCAEVLAGNGPAKALYMSLGFRDSGTVTGVMPGNEEFRVTACIMERTID